MAPESRSTSDTYKYTFNGRNYTKVCAKITPTSYLGSIVIQDSYESVDSYRGKVVYVDVGRKKRKAFHPFQRYKYKLLSYDEAFVCKSSPVIYKGWANNFPFYPMQLRLDRSDWRDIEQDINGGWYGDPPPIFFGRLYELGNHYRDFVIRDAYIKLNSPRFNTAVFLAELDETIVGIHGLFKNCLGSLRRTSIASKNIKHLLLNPEELWLWWRYMLMPTMMDVEDLIKVATEKAAQIDRVQDGSQMKEPDRQTGTIYLANFGSGYFDIPCHWQADVKIGCGAALDVLMRYDPAPWGTSAWDVLMGTWERIPFSFIFDWFINVGDWLASLRNIEVQIAQSYATFAIDTSVTLTETEIWETMGPSKTRSFLMDRIVDIEPPTLPLVDRKWRNTLRTIDLITLTIGMLKGILNRRK